jgi:hypothetical protein
MLIFLNFTEGMEVEICNFIPPKGKLYNGLIGIITAKTDEGKFMVEFDNKTQAPFALRNLRLISINSKIIQSMGLYEDANILWVIGDACHSKNEEITDKICNLAKERNGFCFQESVHYATHYKGNLDDLNAAFRYTILMAFTAIKAEEKLIDVLARKKYCMSKIVNLLFSMSYDMKPRKAIKEYKTMMKNIYLCNNYDVLKAYADKIVNGTIDLDFEKIYNHYFENDQYSEIMKELLQSNPHDCFKITFKDDENMPACLKPDDGVKEKIRIIEQEAREIEMAKRVLKKIKTNPKMPIVVLTGRAHLENLVNLLGTAGGKKIRTHVIYPSKAMEESAWGLRLRNALLDTKTINESNKE